MIEANTLPRVPARRASGGLTRKLMRQPVGLIAAAVLLLLYAAAFLGPYFYTASPTLTDALHTTADSSGQHVAAKFVGAEGVLRRRVGGGVEGVGQGR